MRQSRIADCGSRIDSRSLALTPEELQRLIASGAVRLVPGPRVAPYRPLSEARRERERAASKRRWAKRIADGLCAYCGRRPPVKNRRGCKPYQEKKG